MIEKDGKKEFVVLPYQEFAALKEALEDYEDLLELRRAKSEEQHQPSQPLGKIAGSLNLKP